ncbi:MAG TPA: DMT family transporter, partial [Opitutaceae bacterium]|nr:DMT family transporter [Opitutaceae bacterium]
MHRSLAAVLGAVLTAIFFSLSSIFANRSVREVGPARTNAGRMAVAFIFLALYAYIWGKGTSGVGLGYMIVSGVFGLGLGDLAVYAALPFLGSRLTVMMTQCLAAPIAAATERVWLGTRLTFEQWSCGLVVLVGIALALAPSKKNPPRVKVRPTGFIFGALSAVGQGLGAVFSRKAYELNVQAGQQIDGVTAAYQRLLGGLIVTFIFLSLFRWLQPANVPGSSPTPSKLSWRSWRWPVAHGLTGAVIGVSFYQWALATTPSGIVLPIVATTPIVIIPLVWLIDGEKAAPRSIFGGVIAVAGAVG